MIKENEELGFYYSGNKWNKLLQSFLGPTGEVQAMTFSFWWNISKNKNGGP